MCSAHASHRVQCIMHIFSADVSRGTKENQRILNLSSPHAHKQPAVVKVNAGRKQQKTRLNKPNFSLNINTPSPLTPPKHRHPDNIIYLRRRVQPPAYLSAIAMISIRPFFFLQLSKGVNLRFAFFTRTKNIFRFLSSCGRLKHSAQNFNYFLSPPDLIYVSTILLLHLISSFIRCAGFASFASPVAPNLIKLFYYGKYLPSLYDFDKMLLLITRVVG